MSKSIIQKMETKKKIAKILHDDIWTIILMVGLFLTIVVKSVIFQWIIFDDICIENFVNALKFYGGVISFALFISSFILITRKYLWSIITLLLIDTWLLANYIYYKSGGHFMSLEVMQMADNMKGFWGSVTAYLNWDIFLCIGMTIVYLILLIFTLQKAAFTTNRNWKLFFMLLLCCYLYVPFRQFVPWRSGLTVRKMENPYISPIRATIYNLSPLFTPYHSVSRKAYVSYISGSMSAWEEPYIKKQGILDYFPAMFVYHLSYQYHSNKNNDQTKHITFTEAEKAVLDRIYSVDEIMDVPSPQRNLIIILVESFESWVIDYYGEQNYAMPNVREFIESSNIFYADKVTSQAKQGISGDGQMTVVTGLLPIQSGAACRLYGDNKYPNIAQFYPNSITLNPSVGAWNQSVVNTSYGIKELYEDFESPNDSIVLDYLKYRLLTDSVPTFYLCITLSSHVPFSIADNVQYAIDDKMPQNMQKYIRAMHYVDTQLGHFFDFMNSHPEISEKSDIVITGDHTVFKKLMLNEMLEYAQCHGMSLANGKNYCPLIIKSSSISKSLKYTDVAYQMDIFPTIKTITGLSGYYWSGFGIDLLDTSNDRKFTEEEAYALSDKIIRTDYFQGFYSK